MAAFEVIALDTATPQLRAPGASDTYTFPRAVEMPLGTANGVLYLNGSKVVTSGSGLVFDASGNLGLGVTPSANNIAKTFELQTGFNMFGYANLGYINANAYYNGGWLYKNTAAAGRYEVGDAHKWHTAPSGTAGNTISFTQAMTLDASGNLLVGNTSASFASGGGINVKNSSTSNVRIISGSNTGFDLSQDTSGNTYVYNRDNGFTAFATNSTERARITSGGNFVVGTAALATTATDGFLYVPTCAGTPTGTPTTQTGTAPIVVDTTNNKLYFYSGGQWRDAGP